MEIGFIYSRKDPRQRKAREFLDTYCQELGIMARVVEAEKPVKSPTLIINGHALTDMRQTPRQDDPPMFPSIRDIARAIEQHAWSL